MRSTSENPAVRVDESTRPDRASGPISVVLPVFRTAAFLHPLYQRLTLVLGRIGGGHEILFVDDCSPDSALEILRGIADLDPRVRVVALRRNVGQHRAVIEGLRHASGEIAVVMDSDLQDPPEAIPDLVAGVRGGTSIVFGGRHGRYESGSRLLTSKCHKTLLHKVVGIPVDAGMFFACDRETVRRLLTITDPQPFVTAILGCTGLSMSTVPVARSKRGSGSSSYTGWMRGRASWRAIRCALRVRGAFSVARDSGEKGKMSTSFPDGRSEDPGAGSEIERHNRNQIRYFSREIKATMIPEDTPYNRRHVEELVRALRLEPGARILEVGCGMGRQTFMLAERGFRVEGLDLVPFLLDKLALYNGGRFHIPTHLGDALDAPAGLHGRFDAVVGFFVLHHFSDLAASFRSMARVLKPGGHIGFVEPNAYNPFYALQILITPRMTWEGDGGYIRMRKIVLFEAMAAAGLNRPGLSRFGFFPRFLANRKRAAGLDKALERFPLWRPLLPFQVFSGSRD